MNPSSKALKVSQQCQDDCTGEKFVRKRAVSQIDQKQRGTKCDLDRFYVNSILQAQTALDRDEFFKITPIFNENQSSVTGSIEKEENVSENTTDDAD